MEGGEIMSYVRSELSEKNPYWLEKHRYYELKHFCLQYPIWKKTYSSLLGIDSLSRLERNKSRLKVVTDRTGEVAVKRLYLAERMKMVEDVAAAADEALAKYIVLGVTENRSYTYLKTYCNIPCGKDMYYDRYRKFFWLLNQKRK